MAIPRVSLLQRITLGTLLSALSLSSYAASCEQHYIQTFVSSVASKAETMKNGYSQKGFPTTVTAYQNNGKTLYRVRTGPFSGRDSALQSQQKMKTALRGDTALQNSVLVSVAGSCAGNTPQSALKNATQCYLKKSSEDVNAIQLTEQGGKVSGYHFWRPDGRDGAYGSLNGAITNNKVTGKRYYSVEGDTGSDNFSYVLNSQQLIDGTQRYNKVSCSSVKDMIDVSKAVAKTLPGANRTSVRFRDYKVSGRYQGDNHPLVMSEFSRNFRTRLSQAIKTGKPSFARDYIVTGWGCGSGGCNTGAVINAKTGVVTPFPVSLSSIYPLKPQFENEDGQEHIYRLDSRLMIFAGNLEGSEHTDGRDIIEFYELRNGKFIFLESRAYGRREAY